MSKKPLFAVYNDQHLGVGNEEAVLVSIRHMVENLIAMNIDTVIFNGDFFHSRSNQTQEVLKTATEIFRIINEAGIRHIVNVGNHDRTSYYSSESFLDPFRHHPGVEIYDGKITTLEIKGVKVSLSPFFHDSILVPMLEEAEGGDILLGHWEMQGSTHLGKVNEKQDITRRMLKKWKKVYLGHYHNFHEISKDIAHLPSLRQNSFGEDSLKGFSIIYNDLSYEIIQGVFKRFNKLTLDIDTLTPKDLKELIAVHRDSEHTIRFEFTGEESKLKALDKEQFKDTGIDIKIKFEKKYSVDITEKPVLIKKFDKDLIYESFEKFCEEKDYSHEEGLVFLDEFFNKQEGENVREKDN
jgi:hypothetical protein